LKILWLHGCAGSSPASGTTNKNENPHNQTIVRVFDYDATLWRESSITQPLHSLSLLPLHRTQGPDQCEIIRYDERIILLFLF
ncbi:MAG: hypothetical protein ACOYM7_08840, partial [Paludibacter sp.]